MKKNVIPILFGTSLKKKVIWDLKKDNLGYLSHLILAIEDKRERECVFEALKCLPVDIIVFLFTKVHFTSTSDIYGRVIKPYKDYSTIILVKELFERESKEMGIKVVLHEVAHSLVHYKVLKVPKGVNEEKFCDRFAKKQFKRLDYEKSNVGKRLGC